MMHYDKFNKKQNFAIVLIKNETYIQLLGNEKIIDVIKIPFDISSFDEFCIKINAEIIHNINTEQLCCPISLDIMIEPVITSCGHTFCKTQLDKCNNACPLCRTKILYYLPDYNLINIYKTQTFMMNNIEITYDELKDINKIKILCKSIINDHVI